MKANNTLRIMRQEIYASMRRPFFVIMAFGVPVVMGLIAIITYTLNNSNEAAEEEAEPVQEPLTQGFIDPGSFIQVIPADIPFVTLLEFPDEAAAREALEEGGLDGYFLVSEDYIDTGELTYVVADFNPISDQTRTLVFERVLTLNLLEADLLLSAAALEPYDVTYHQIAVTDGPLEQNNWLAQQLPFFLVILLYIVILVPASILVSSITDEKKNRVLEILLSSVSASQFFIGKLLALGLLGILQTLAWIGVVWGVAEFGGQPLNLPVEFALPTGLLVWAVVFSLLGYAMYGTQMAGIGALAPNLNDTRSLTIIVLSPLIIGYLFNILYMDAPDSLLAVILSIFPLTAPVVMIGRMAATDLPAWQPVVSLVFQILAVLIIVRFFTRLFRAQALLSGQTPTVRHLLRALREA